MLSRHCQVFFLVNGKVNISIFFSVNLKVSPVIIRGCRVEYAYDITNLKSTRFFARLILIQNGHAYAFLRSVIMNPI